MWVADVPRIPHGCGCGCGSGAGQQLQLRFHPLPGTLPVPRVRPSVHKHPVKSHPHHPSLQSDSDPLCFCFNARGEPPSGLKPGPALGSHSGPAPAHRVLGMTRWVDFCQALPRLSLSLFYFSHCFVSFLTFFHSFFFCFALEGLTRGIWWFPEKGSRWNCSCLPQSLPQPQPRRIQASSSSSTTAHGNARSLTH